MRKMIVNWLIANGSIDEKERELYEYAAYSLQILVVPVLYAFVVGGVLDEWGITFCFVFVFAIVRKFSGGFHAKTELQCTIFSVILIFSGVNLVKKLEIGMELGIAFFSSVIFLLKYSPVDSENRKLDLDEKKANHKKVVIIQLLAGIGASILWRLNFDGYAKSIMIANIFAMLLQGLGIVTNK